VIGDGGVRDDCRFTCWLVSDERGAAAFAGVGELLTSLDAPAGMTDAQHRLAAASVAQGVSVDRTPDGDHLRLYVHHRDAETRATRYDALRCNDAGAITRGSYELHYLPRTPDGAAPADLAHRSLSATVARMSEQTRLQEMSAFWLRRTPAGVVDQVDLGYPWHPPLDDVAQPLRELTSALGAPHGWLDEYAGHHLRHVSFSGRSARVPGFTLYFSGACRGAWPCSLHGLKSLVREDSASVNETLERHVFDRVPARIAAPGGRPRTARDTARPDAWRALLGPAMHEHFGLFEPRSSLPEALDRAVTVLYPFVPAGGRVYDVGCGWGATNRMLTRELGCDVVGITARRSEFLSGREQGLNVRHGDAESTLPPGHFDCMLAIESLSEIADKRRLLEVLRIFGRRLVLRETCHDDEAGGAAFAGATHAVSAAALRAAIEDAGWTITRWRDRRPESMPTVQAWHDRLAAIAAGDDLRLEALRAWTARVLPRSHEWAACNPLIEVVAQ
jgi:hypothetical protein